MTNHPEVTKKSGVYIANLFDLIIPHSQYDVSAKAVNSGLSGFVLIMSICENRHGFIGLEKHLLEIFH